MIIVVTGAAGFIGSNIIRALNQLGYNDIIAVDNLTNGIKCKNLNDCEIMDYVDKEDFITAVQNQNYEQQIDYVFHQGACSNTLETDGRYMMKNNYEYSCLLLEYAQRNEIPFIYASSAAVYGINNSFIEAREFEQPLNIYGYSKFLFDQMVRRYFKAELKSPIVGLRYFNVYGRGESHKARMASVVYHHFNQLQQNGKVQLYDSCQGYLAGAQSRDFISIEDVVKINMFFFNNHNQASEELSGIFNCGTGLARTFNDLALATINSYRKIYQQQSALNLFQAQQIGLIEYIPFPSDLTNKYQCFTQANPTNLIASGYNQEFLSLEGGIMNYVKQLLL